MNDEIEKNITVDELVSMIKDNPEKEKIERLRAIKTEGGDYASLKESLPVFVPNALFRKSLGRDNFLFGTGYYYLDIDDKATDAYELKRQFLELYADSVFLCAVSCSLGGIMILVKLDRCLDNYDEFPLVYEYLTHEVFSGFDFDNKVRNAGRINFITYDPDVFINKDAVIQVSGIDFTENYGQ